MLRRFCWTSWTRFVMVCALVAMAATPALAQGDPSGRWQGAIELPGTALRVEVDLAQADSGWSGTISIPQQNARNVRLENVRVAGDSVGFVIAGIPGAPTFAGVLAADGANIAGMFTQGGQSFPFALERAAAVEAEANAALDGLDAWVADAMRDWMVPGLAVAVVKDGRVVYSKGFGYRDVARKLPVTPQTLFAIGSATKAFTTFAMGQLVDAGKLDWDAPAITYLPELRMQDEYATLHLTPLDMVTHRSGLPRHDFVWYNSDALDASSLVGRVPSFEPNRELRREFQYNNIMFGLAGQIVSTLTGKPWEAAIRSGIIEPLGMTSTNFSVHESQRATDYALPYGESKDTLRLLGFRPLNNVVASAAGGINSNVEDMSKWLLVHLQDGMAGDTQLIQKSTLDFLHAPQTVIPGVPAEPELSPRTYAPGWFVDDYRGHLRVEHGGNIDGFTALVSMFPHDDVGIVVFANKNGSPLPQFAVRNIADRLFDLPVKDWTGEALRERAAARALNRESEALTAAARVPKTRPAHPLRDYAGDYAHPGYGTVAIRLVKDRLHMTYNNITAPLEHWHYEVFKGLENQDDPALADMKIMFASNLDGDVETLSAPFEPSIGQIVFTRAPDAELSDPAYIAKFAGEYALGPQMITVSVQGDRLTATVPGQPTYDLEPLRNNTFELAALTGFQIQFVVEDGKVTQAIFIQPNGRFPATRVEKRIESSAHEQH